MLGLKAVNAPDDKKPVRIRAHFKDTSHSISKRLDDDSWTLDRLDHLT